MLDRPDYLAGALLQSLMRPMIEPFAPQFIRTLILAVVSFGIIPLIQMPRRLRGFAARERDQLAHLANWMRIQFGSDAETLDPRTPGLDRVVHLLRLVSWAGAITVMGAIGWYLWNDHDLEDLTRSTYAFFSVRAHGNRGQDELLFTIWMVGLCVGYAAQWLAIQVHQARVRTFVTRFNVLAARQNLRKLAPPVEALGLRPIWLAGAVGLMCLGSLWGIPLMLAGAAQTRYIRHRSRWMRAELAQRVREVLQQTRPTMMLAVPVVLRRKCPVAVCKAPLPQAATFCPRCGVRVAAVDRVA